MKRLAVSIFILGVTLTACGGNGSPLGLDAERIQEGVTERAMNIAAVKNGDYEEEDIEVVRICAAVPRGKEAFGHQGDYVVFWQTSDGQNQYEHRMNEEDYKVGGTVNRFEPYEDIGCYDYQN
jgi:IMP cyclohydrolase